MSNETRKKIIEKLPGKATLPKNIKFCETLDGLEMTLSMPAIGKSKQPSSNLNMQTDSAAFEGWAVVVYTHYVKPFYYGEKIIILKTEENLKFEKEIDFTTGNGHYHRFLYRAMRFAEQYPNWFVLDKNLKEVIKEFKNSFDSIEFVNNYPSKETGKNDELSIGLTTESGVEKYLVENSIEGKALLKKAGLKTERLFRQLPVGLFREKKKAGNSLFTRGKSAIDLWSTDENKIAIFELKTDNKMIGIITELFFYTNYVNDVFIEKNNIIPEKTTQEIEKNRGYPLLTEKCENKKIESYFLSNAMHPLITETEIELLNNNINNGFKYGNLCYQFTLKAEIER